jgi:hypothetical protein
MSKIKFRGIEYNSLADMPAKVRHDYFKTRAGYEVTEEKPKSKEDMMPAGLENMPAEVREIYERVRGDLDAKPIKTSPIDELPKTEDLYRRSAPAGMRNQPSDEVVYKPSPPIIKPPPPIVESDHTLRRLAIGLLLVVLVLGLIMAFLLYGS